MMYIWVLSLWFISLLMACWSFSLLVRWVSDWNARRRRRLTPMYSKKAFRLAPVLMAVCAGIAIAAGYWAEHLASIYGDSIGFFRTSLGVGSLLLIAAGFVWIILSAVGDRARGRVRCPKCWYDMSDVPGLLCPECGRESKSRSQHTRTRRPRWAFVIAGLSIGLGVYGAWVNRRVNLIGPLAAVPTWALMAGWDLFPAHWIYDDGTMKPDGTPVALESCLQKRLGDEDWISKAQAARFAKKLGKPMLGSKEARWDSKRLGLLSMMSLKSEYWWEPDSYPKPPRGIDFDELLRLCSLDVLDALKAESPTAIDELILDAAHNDDQNAYMLAHRWVLLSFDPQATSYYPAYTNNARLRAHIQGVLAPMFEQINQPEIVGLIQSQDRDQRKWAIWLMMDSKAMDLHYRMFDKFIGYSFGSVEPWDANFFLAQTIALLPAESLAQANETISAWLKSDDLQERIFALEAIDKLVQMNTTRPDGQPAFDVEPMLELVRLYCLGDSRLAHGANYPGSTVDQLAINILAYHDRTGLVSFPIIRELIDTRGEPYFRILTAFRYVDEWNEESFEAWLDAFSSLADSNSPKIRQWMLDYLPTRTDSTSEQAFVELAASMQYDPDEGVAAKARDTLWDRGRNDLVDRSIKP